jgi:hypothetical protein
MINTKQILANAPSNIGEQVHVNHIGCEAGVDNKRRLYIKRVDKGLVAYCHHCNQSGFAATDNSSRLAAWLNKPHKTTEAARKPILANITAQGRIWLKKYYCNSVEDKDYFNGIAGEPNKVALTLRNIKNEIIGYQVRNLHSNSGPKYLTHYVNSESNGDPSWFYKMIDTLVITEDYLSAYRVFNSSSCSSLALLRTSLSDKTLFEISEREFKNIIIWLDPDEAGREGAAKVYKKLSHYLPTKTVIAIYDNDKEPKECSPAELRDILS